jgi:hypothetical protein
LFQLKVYKYENSFREIDAPDELEDASQTGAQPKIIPFEEQPSTSSLIYRSIDGRIPTSVPRHQDGDWQPAKRLKFTRNITNLPLPKKSLFYTK